MKQRRWEENFDEIISFSFLYMELSDFGILVRSSRILGGDDSQGGVDGKIGRRRLSLRRLCRCFNVGCFNVSCLTKDFFISWNVCYCLLYVK